MSEGGTTFHKATVRINTKILCIQIIRHNKTEFENNKIYGEKKIKHFILKIKTEKNEFRKKYNRFCDKIKLISLGPTH